MKDEAERLAMFIDIGIVSALVFVGLRVFPWGSNEEKHLRGLRKAARDKARKDEIRAEIERLKAELGEEE